MSEDLEIKELPINQDLLSLVHRILDQNQQLIGQHNRMIETNIMLLGILGTLRFRSIIQPADFFKKR